MEETERPPSKRSHGGGNASEKDDTQETKQQRLDRFSAAAWYQSQMQGGDMNIQEDTESKSSDSKTDTDDDESHPPQNEILPPPPRPQRLHANSSVTVTSFARDRQLEEFAWPGDVDCTTAKDDEVGPREKPQLKRRLTKLANKKSHPLEHIGITLGVPMILLCDLIIPCIIYYTWFLRHSSKWKRDCRGWHDRNEACPIERREFDEDIMGSAVACFGIG